MVTNKKDAQENEKKRRKRKDAGEKRRKKKMQKKEENQFTKIDECLDKDLETAIHNGGLNCTNMCRLIQKSSPTFLGQNLLY